jgi:hypothetical protein
VLNYPKEKLNWIPWQRYMLFLTVDRKKTISLGRFRRHEGIRHIIERLSVYRGYELQVADTKNQRFYKGYELLVIDTP